MTFTTNTSNTTPSFQPLKISLRLAVTEFFQNVTLMMSYSIPIGLFSQYVDLHTELRLVHLFFTLLYTVCTFIECHDSNKEEALN